MPEPEADHGRTLEVSAREGSGGNHRQDYRGKRGRHQFVWALLAAPAVAWTIHLSRQGAAMAEDAVNPSGALSAVLLIFALLATPLRRVWPRAGVTRWLLRNRRYLGVASFGYALWHTLFYIVDAGSARSVIADLPRLDIWTGWLSLMILVPLAATSSDAAVRRLGRGWKPLQRWTYAAALLGLLHALSLNGWEDTVEPLVVAGPLIVLQVWRVLGSRRRPGAL
ncbi:ferric reductase-like transmembrane domain-containing protein [Citreimonas salinaria]|uniref:Sulfoxide reductase heme-binding subunit YedZ n=1 Tax=Citreimonas salinaria TaxID=321339 RepID=A0A1H3P5A5_9RHOB|nr:ferric reductase-like transmembrane domain-containing protein [Citreimonas salinaria]SDY96306.1 sulfoxide reductase heme-binding subunit YedZ [Citreimonas salinaria]